MFGKKQDAAPDLKKVYLERLAFNERERNFLEDHGGIKTIATVAGSRKLFDFVLAGDPSLELDFAHPPQEHEVYAQVRAQDGTTFPAAIPLFLDEIGDPPAAGESVHVVYHPTERARVRFVICWRGPPRGHGSARWRVPAACPQCGAPVDQSVESFAPHPTCRMCSQPLPCQPAS